MLNQSRAANLVFTVVILLFVVGAVHAQLRPKGAPIPTPTPQPWDCDREDARRLASVAIELLNHIPFPVEPPPSCEGPATICQSQATVTSLQNALQHENSQVDIRLRLWSAALRCQ